MTLVEIAGAGLAELTCARLLTDRGHRVRLPPLRPPGRTAGAGPRPLLLTGPTLELVGSLWGDGLIEGGWPITHRHARWGAGPSPAPFPQPGRALDGVLLAARMRERLGAGDKSGEPPEWTVTAAPGEQPVHEQAGRRKLLAGSAPLRSARDQDTARLDCTGLGWLHLTPLGRGDCLVQAMVPGPAEAPAELLARLLADSAFAALLRRPPRTAVALAAAPRVHLAPAVPPTAGGGGMLVVGSGALRYDPLSGTGTAQALRTAILAAAVIDAAAAGRSATALCAHYANRLRAAFRDHLHTCLRLYTTAFGAGPWQDEIDATRAALRTGRQPLLALD
ncbi:hypothetical protein OG373_33150 [Streptomyces avidinii]|uniref:hypothetical protein n=1 Tax=Streptomyces avidinii TaxID=1895 RepID=UPI0038692F28|nr:hypothetical protein OG373_33150 [Streptomyces avidinii]